MMCENVYQSLMCCEFSGLATTPCQSLIVPHLQIGSRPMARRMAAAAATMPAATSGHAARERDGGTRRIAEGVSATSDPRIHASGVQDAARVERRLDSRGDAHHRLGWRLEDVDARADLVGRANEGGMAAHGAQSRADRLCAGVALQAGRDPDQAAAPIVIPAGLDGL